ncbi:cytidine deaminase-like [Musca vetustissima]|uniref:cytidine deaminase-like n=1 Tax=Musca vetustissima TaxID=27455 RepID=UPI002AB60B9F|nr:cytidine deaminase-like [Musca vetustissima]
MDIVDTTKVTGLKKANIPETIKLYQDLDDDSKELLRCANKVRQNAYVPYSNFKVGAAFRTKCGRIFSGCNVENAAFTPGSCAERTALCKAVSEGFREFSAGAVVAYQEDAFTPPCGVCRQFIMEFAADDLPIYVTKAVEGTTEKLENHAGDHVLCTSIYNLLPNGFRNFK